MKLRENLKQILALRDMSAAELSRQCKSKAGKAVPKATISHWLSGGSVRNLDSIHAVSRVLGVTVDELLFGDPKNASKSEPSLFDLLVTDQSDGWLAGRFEIKLRRLKHNE